MRDEFKLSNLSFAMGVVPMEWRGACIVPLFKGKGENVNVATLEVLVLSVVSKLFGIVLIKRVRAELNVL